MTVQSVLVLHVLIAKVSAGSAGPARDTCVQEYMLHKLPDTLYSSRCWTARFSRSFASACTRSFDLSVNSQTCVRDNNLSPALSGVHPTIHRFRITLAAHHQSLLTAPAYPARDVPWSSSSAMRHQAPSPRASRTKALSLLLPERPDVPPARAAITACYPGLPWFCDSHALFW
jgi:hypothetical protein